MLQKARPDEPANLKPHRRLTYKIVAGLATFGLTFAVSTLLPANTTPDLLWNTGTSLFFAGVVFIAQYLFEVERKLEKLGRKLDDHQARVTGQMADGIANFHLATELFGLREAAQLKRDEINEITELIRYRARITTDATPLVQEFAQTEISRLADSLKQIGENSDLTYEGEDHDWLLGLTKVAKRSIQATSLSSVDVDVQNFVDGSLWGRDLGQRYLDLQRQAIQRGVRIQRLFIIDRDGLRIQDLDAVLPLHLRIGIEARTLDATAAPRAFQALLRDFVIFDGVLSFQSTAAHPIGQHNPIVVSTTLVTHRERVHQRIREFGRLWSSDGVKEAVLDSQGKVVFRRPPDANSDVAPD